MGKSAVEAEVVTTVAASEEAEAVIGVASEEAEVEIGVVDLGQERWITGATTDKTAVTDPIKTVQIPRPCDLNFFILYVRLCAADCVKLVPFV